MSDGRLKIDRKVRSKLFCHPTIFWPPNSKIHYFNLEKHTPPKKRPFFWGGGSIIWRPYNCNVTCAVNMKRSRPQIKKKVISLCLLSGVYLVIYSSITKDSPRLLFFFYKFLISDFFAVKTGFHFNFSEIKNWYTEKDCCFRIQTRYLKPTFRIY